MVLILTPQGEIMWVHPNLVKSQQWTTITDRKSKSKGKVSSCNVVCASSIDAEIDVTSIADEEEEEIVLTIEQRAPPLAETRSDQQYLKKYDEAVASSSKPAKEPTKQSTKRLVKKHKEFRYAKALQKDKAKRSSIPFCFDILA